MASDESEAARPVGPPPATGNGEFGVCSRCHQPLTHRSVSGGCLRCMMSLVVLDDVVEPVTGTEEVRRYSHFEIVLAADGSLDELGHGAMGTTYRALDSVLQSPVALKVIGRNVADSPAVRSRFLREARAAARLRHPNVASVFHYGEQQGECFYVMELVEGETLEERVRRDGPFPVAIALEIGVQVARALAAAEAQGLVHRDLKPSNVMLVAGNDADGKSDGLTLIKVIDFGLAKAVAASQAEAAAGESDTRHGFVGTPAYASPEQFARNGNGNHVDTRSDIYSLGVTLWYLLCGRIPFRGHSLEEIHDRQVAQALPVEQLSSQRVPAPVIALLRAMLSVDPNARPQSSRDLLDALQRCQAKLSASRSNRLRRAWIVVAALLLLFTLVVIVIVRGKTGLADATRPATASTEGSVAVLPFENRSPDPSAAFFAAGMQDAVTTDLSRLAGLKVIGPKSVHSYAPGHRDLPAIGRALGVTHLLEGSVWRDGERVRVTLHLADTQGSTHSWSKQYDCPLSEVPALRGEMTREVSERLRRSLSSEERAIIERPPTTDPVAYDLYLRARARSYLFPDEAAVRRDAEQKISLLNAAVARDPNFVLAYCELARAHGEIVGLGFGATPEERAIDHRTMAEVALHNARRLQPDAAEVHLALARHFFWVSKDSEQARIEADLAVRGLPNNAEAHALAARIDRLQGRWDDALRGYEKAVSIEPHENGIRYDLANTYYYLRCYDQFDHELARIIADTPDGSNDDLSLERAVGQLAARADLKPLRDALAALPAAVDPDGSVRDNYSLVLSLFARDSEGVAHILAASPRTRFLIVGFAYPKAWFEALAARERGDDAAARTAFAVARVEVEKSVLEDASDARALSLLAMVDAGLGHREEAIHEAKRACEITPIEKQAVSGPTIACCLAVVYAWTDQPDQAIAGLDKLVTLPAGSNEPNQPTYGDLCLNPLWDPLRSDPRFATLVNRLAPKSPR